MPINITDVINRNPVLVVMNNDIAINKNDKMIRFGFYPDGDIETPLLKAMWMFSFLCVFKIKTFSSQRRLT